MTVRTFVKRVMAAAALSVAPAALFAAVPAFAQGRGRGGGETALGNNLSVLAVFAEGIGLLDWS